MVFATWGGWPCSKTISAGLLISTEKASPSHGTLGLNPLVQSALEGFACLAGAKGEAERAARLWGAAQALHETKGIPRDTDFLAEADARISAVRSGMGEEAWEEAWRKGRAMTLDEAVSYALEEEEAGG